MGTNLIVILVIVAIVVILVCWIISQQRALVRKDENCKNALSQIGVQQSSRWDALTALADLTKGYSEHEYKTLRDVIAMRQSITGNSSVADVENQETMLTNAFKQISAVAEAYPELKANQMFIKTMDSVNVYENQVRMSRMIFNDTVNIYNRATREFPGSIVAGMLGFRQRDYLKEDATKVDMPSMKF